MVISTDSRGYNLETPFLFLDYENAFDEVRRTLLFSILKEINIHNQLVTTIIKIYDNNEIRIKVDTTLTPPIIINKGVRQGCSLSLTLLTLILLTWRKW